MGHGPGPDTLKHVLIISPESDEHARAVARELRRQRHEVVIFDTAHFPEKARFRFDIAHDTCVSSLQLSRDSTLEAEWADVVWLRRPAVPGFSESDWPLEDRALMAAQFAVFSNWALAAFAPNARWVNAFGAHIAASNKILQLRVAKELGLNVPRTLFSNDSAAAVEFVGVPSVAKPIVRERPSHLGELHATQRVSAADIAVHGPVEPFFLQQHVDKVAEVRVHVLGQKVVAVLLKPRSKWPQRVDWNFDRHTFACSNYTLPPNIESGCLALADRLGLVFCIIDFVVGKDGDLTFLELNQMGQFLWLDDLMPGLYLAKEFSQLLTGGQP